LDMLASWLACAYLEIGTFTMKSNGTGGWNRGTGK